MICLRACLRVCAPLRLTDFRLRRARRVKSTKWLSSLSWRQKRRQTISGRRFATGTVAGLFSVVEIWYFQNGDRLGDGCCVMEQTEHDFALEKQKLVSNATVRMKADYERIKKDMEIQLLMCVGFGCFLVSLHCPALPSPSLCPVVAASTPRTRR